MNSDKKSSPIKLFVCDSELTISTSQSTPINPVVAFLFIDDNSAMTEEDHGTKILSHKNLSFKHYTMLLERFFAGSFYYCCRSCQDFLAYSMMFCLWFFLTNQCTVFNNVIICTINKSGSNCIHEFSVALFAIKCVSGLVERTIWFPLWKAMVWISLIVRHFY